MKRYLGSLAMVFLLGTSVLGVGAIARAQQGPPDSRQPMEIPPMQYPAQQGGPQRGAPPPQQIGPQQQGQGDPGAARISFIRGDVSTQRGDTGEWVAATLNTPVVAGDHVSTGRNSRGELELDNANILRMSDESTANVVALSPTQIQLQIGQGLVNYDVLKNSEADIEIQTPNVAIHPQMGEGSYRILVNSDGETIIDVRNGSAEISTPQGSTRVERDQRITIQGDADNAQYQVSATSSRDDWDKWNSDRDRTIEGAESWNHTNPYYTGSQDLDGNGQWNSVPDYGSVWFPSEGSDWAPYRDGRWVFEPYYGWTWVSYEPWGWAPYHYGRWFVYGGRWGWWPGPVYSGYRPIWAPAYVSFLGFGGGGFGVGIGFGSVGWLPIGPGDRFYPWYGRGVTQVNININNFHNNYGGGFAPLRGGPRAFSNIDGALASERIRNGVSSMSADQFGRGRVPAQQQRFNEGSFRQASVMTGSLPVTPSRESFRPTDRQVNATALPNRTSANQRFFGGSSQGATPQAGRGQFGSNRGGNPGASGQTSARPGWRTFSSPSTQPRSVMGGRTFEPQSGPQSRNIPSQPAEAPRQYQNYSRGSYGSSGYSAPPQPTQAPRQYQNYSRGSYGSNGYSRPPLNMQQPVVTPRGRSYSAPPVRSEPSAPRGGYSGGSSRGGYSSRGSSTSSGGGRSSGHDHR